MTKEHYIYSWHDPRTLVPFYVGLGKGKRAFEKSSHCQHNLTVAGRLHELEKEGLTHIVWVSPKRYSLESAKKLERAWIRIFGRKDQNTGYLFNHSDGGDGGNISKITRERLSAFAKERMKNPTLKAIALENLKQGRKRGWKHSEETKSRIRAARLGKKQSLETKSKISTVNKELAKRRSRNIKGYFT